MVSAGVMGATIAGFLTAVAVDAGIALRDIRILGKL
jgi:hypothetical protein